MSGIITVDKMCAVVETSRGVYAVVPREDVLTKKDVDICKEGEPDTAIGQYSLKPHLRVFANGDFRSAVSFQHRVEEDLEKVVKTGASNLEQIRELLSAEKKPYLINPVQVINQC